LKIKQAIDIGIRWVSACIIGLLALSVSGCGGAKQELNVGVVDFPIAYVKRSIPVDDTGALVEEDLREQQLFQPGADLYLRQRAAPSAAEINITGAMTGGLGDVRWVSASFDGTKLIFSLRLADIDGVDPDDQPTWNVWEYDIANASLRRIIAVDTFAEEGDDIAPHYLTDGRIVFVSSRQSTAKAMLLDEGKPGYAGMNESLRHGRAMVLHIMRADGSHIEQISFNQSNDMTPTVLRSGEILFSRWDGGRTNSVSLYTINPDGTNLQLIYGGHSHDNGSDDDFQFMSPKEMPDGRILVAKRPFVSPLGDQLVVLDVNNFSDETKPLVASMGGRAESQATTYDVSVDGVSLGGRFSAATPLWDGSDRAIIAWSPCRLLDNSRIVPCSQQALAQPQVDEAPPLYGIYIYDFSNDTQLPVVTPKEGVIYSDIVTAQPRQAEYFSASEKDPALIDENVGILHIRSVYDWDGTFNDMGASITGVDTLETMADPVAAPIALQVPRFVRIVKAVAMPDDSVLDIPRSAFGISRANLMRDIVAYAPVEPDGSVKVKVPANVAFTIEVLDERGHRVSARHNNWMQVRPGEELACNGCHDQNSDEAHGRKLPERSINSGAATSGQTFNAGTDAAMIAEMGETMAETRIRLACGTAQDVISCPDLSPKMNLTYNDVWTDTTRRLAAPAFDYQYQNLNSDIPTRSACLTSWEAGCRITINYEQHIHPLWSVPREDSVTLQDTTCNTCHSTADSEGALQLPAGQLDLSDGPSSPESGRFQAYQELFVQDQEQAIVGELLTEVFILVPALDEQGQQILDAQGLPVPDVPEPVDAPAPAKSVNGARASYFMEKMLNQELNAGRSLTPTTDINYVDHRAMLSEAELKLISEWLDLGGQYYNNPFDIPIP